MQIKHALMLVTVVSAISCSCAHAQPLDSLVHHAIEFGKQQLAATVASLGDSIVYPRSTLENGKWRTVNPGDWTSGFFPGALWYAYELTGETALKQSAETWTNGLEWQKLNTKTHDVGFIMYCSFGNANRLQPNARDKEILLQSARSLAMRYNPNVGCIRSWDFGEWQFPVIIDNMMNLELLFWASKNGGGKELYDITVSHALHTLKNHFRVNGSTYHVVSYDSTTGEVLRKQTHQGYADESVWARGQAWAIYGFTMTYRETRDERFLKAAERAAGWFENNLPDDFIPYWDFTAPQIPNESRDVSAASIVASALYELHGFAKDEGAKAKYRKVADAILAALCQAPYLAEGTTSGGILNRAVGNMPAKSEVDVSLIYADYYFLEALKRFQSVNNISKE